MPENLLDKSKSPKPGLILKKFIKYILPSKKVILLATFFYFFGIFIALDNHDLNNLPFAFGFLTGNLSVQFCSNPITLDYLKLQFIDYLGKVTQNIFLSNMQIALLCIFSGIFIIPAILVGLISFSGDLLYTLGINFGLKGIIMYSGLLHLHLEIWAALLSIDAFIVFYWSIIKSFRDFSYNPFVDDFKNKFLPLIVLITILFVLAAFFEVFWSTWWVYIFTHPYISWSDFYFYVNSCRVV